MGEWYYIGHYGQLGPLTREQIDELISGEVIARDTYVWKVGMDNWIPAGQILELANVFSVRAPFDTPPPPPGPYPVTPPEPSVQVAAQMPQPTVFASYPHTYGVVQSDRNRILAGVLQLIIPGAGRLYLGYYALGVIQLVASTCGLGWVWSLVDGILILVGNVKLDGYGRQMKD
ncbi:MAG: GYF domain-containing protein [Fimbriimonas sp.]|nr:GYF domain-containing protein [Fimbriimonas sp.]